jgi:predicted enzyme related to lactoylglutathione lyase
VSQAILYVRDLGLLTTFYRDCLGLEEVETSADHSGLRADGLVLWLVRRRRPRKGEAIHEEPARKRSEVPVKLAFEVPTLDGAADSIERLGGTTAGADWDFAGYRRRDVVDPEGNVIQLLEPLPPLSA